MSKTLYMTKGLPASGKTTWSKQMIHTHKAGEVVRINKDDLRAMMHDSRFDRDRTEKLVLTMRDAMIRAALADKFTSIVIIDDTNFAPQHEQQLRQLADEMRAEFRIQDFTDVPVKDCIERDLKRPNSVGHKVINGMNMRYIQPKYEPPKYDPNLPTAIMVDIDGTLGHMNDRSPYDYSKVLEDTVDEVVRDIVHHYAPIESFTPTDKLIVVSGRPDSCREDTEKWLQKHLVRMPDHLFMRPAEEPRTPDDVVKAQIYDREIKGKFNIRFVLDDRDRVVAMWRQHGLKVLQVNDGDF